MFLRTNHVKDNFVFLSWMYHSSSGRVQNHKYDAYALPLTLIYPTPQILFLLAQWDNSLFDISLINIHRHNVQYDRCICPFVCFSINLTRSSLSFLALIHNCFINVMSYWYFQHWSSNWVGKFRLWQHASHFRLFPSFVSLS